MRKLIFKIGNLNYKTRRLILIFLDTYVLFSSFIFTSLFFDVFLSIKNLENINLFISYFLFLALATYVFTGHYDSLSKFISSISFYRITLRNFLVIIEMIILSFLFDFEFFNLKFAIIFFILISSQISLIRIFIRDLLINFDNNKSNYKTRIGIYGAGAAGIILYESLLKEKKYSIISFFDDALDLKGRSIDGIKIRTPSEILRFKEQIDKLLIAIPSIDLLSRKRILEKLKTIGLPILEVPSLKNIVDKNIRFEGLRSIEIKDLIGREDIMCKNNLIKNEIKGKSVCISGAGGSIGSEICLEIVKYKPETLILIERNEFNLYLLSENLNYLKNINIIQLLGDASDENFIKNIFKKYKIDIVFHAAAYKHVPIVEKNSIEGIKNNLLSTLNLCQFANYHKINNFVLISSDKAVRPTNIMGCSKRICELIIQYYAKNSNSTLFSMVRFGNVLGSSGSVIPKFKEQIKKGGPITITDKRITRYFMTIHEAAELVIQSTVLSKGGDLFLLDMGKEYKIVDLAKQLISLSGLNIKDKANPNGDIEIKQIGLRPGEKLYEELLINGEAKPTIHPLIYMADEKNLINFEKFLDEINKINEILINYDEEKLFKSIKKLVPEWETKVN